MTFGTPDWRDWVLDEAASKPIIQRAIELGINFFDTADVYSRGVSEEVVGRIFKDLVPRDDLVIATKVHGVMGDEPNDRGLSRKHIMQAIDASLRRLQTDYVDLYQIHRFDRYTPVEETMMALHDVVKAGKARYIGASSMYAWQFANMQHTADLLASTHFVAMQNHYNLIYREEEREMNPLCLEEGVGLIPWSPLARGFLAGNRHRQGGGDTTRSNSDDFARSMYYTDSDFKVVDRCMEVASRRGVTSTQIALAWLLTKPAMTSPIVGTSRMSHLEEAVAATEIELTEDEIVALEENYIPHPVLGHG
jgi:aryl-alcohol dehydrogenase (NADP+)